MSYSFTEKQIAKQLGKKSSNTNLRKETEKIKGDIDFLKQTSQIVYSIVIGIGVAVALGFITLIITVFLDYRNSYTTLTESVKELQDSRYQLLNDRLDKLEMESTSSSIKP